jgi:hypothetical protein
MCSQASRYGRFGRALDRGPSPGLSAASELRHVSLLDALELCLLLRRPAPFLAAFEGKVRVCNSVTERASPQKLLRRYSPS